MSRSRRLTAAAVAALVAAALLPSAATATPDTASPEESLLGLRLTGEDTCGYKTVHLRPQAPNLFAPVRLLGEDLAPTAQLLQPYEVFISGEGLKARHLLPGETYTRSGAPPKGLVTCHFFGETDDGRFDIAITGALRGR